MSERRPWIEQTPLGDEIRDLADRIDESAIVDGAIRELYHVIVPLCRRQKFGEFTSQIRSTVDNLRIARRRTAARIRALRKDLRVANDKANELEREYHEMRRAIINTEPRP